MIDSVLKGTGNSRFLKSAVPAGTSWADALAMLQAGTFPIDFNGINTEGFQQVGTPLNKANLLKDATAAQIGLPPSTTPDGMFQALGNTGELHVWRKTVTNQQAGYNLGEPTKNYITSGNTTSAAVVSFSISDSVSVDDLGNVTQDSASTSGPYTIEDRFVSLLQGRFRGKFVKATNAAGYDSNNVVNDGIWYIPVDAIVSCVSNGTSLGYPYNYCFVIDKIQAVSGHGAGTTTTYPVSTNPNAYQEGDDAKAAGYTLGDVVTGNFELAYSANYPRQFKVAESVTVDEAGNITLNSPVVYSFYTNGTGNSRDLIKGKFVTRTDNSPPWVKDGVIYYIPTDAVISYVSTWYEIDRYQPVTGYAAIPAGTTIEYLGKLGDKARVQVLSYIGTGTYGSSNPNSVTANFPIKLLAVLAKTIKNSNGNFSTRIDSDNQYKEDPFMVGAILTTNYTLGSGCGYKGDIYNTVYGKKSEDGKTFSWYTTGSNSARQFNESGYTYIVLLIG